MARRRSRKRAAPRRRSYPRSRRGGRHAPKTVSLVTVGVVGGGLTLVSARAAAAIAPLKAEMEKATGMAGTGLIVAAVGNRVLCGLIPKVGAIERSILKPLGLRP